LIDSIHGWLVRMYYRLRGPNYPFGPDNPAADERAAAEDIADWPPEVTPAELAAEDAK